MPWNYETDLALPSKATDALYLEFLPALSYGFRDYVVARPTLKFGKLS